MAVQKNEVDGKILSLYPEQIRIRPGFNVRQDMGDIKGLTASITESEGNKVPVTVIKTKELTDDEYPVYELVDGHRRLKACIAANTMIRAEVLDLSKESDLIAHMMSTGIGNKEFNMLERAEGMKRYKEAYAEENDGAEVKNADIAKKFGVTQTHVQDCFLLLTAPKDVLTQVRKNIITASAAVEMLKVNNPDDVNEAVGKAVDKANKEGKAKVSKKAVVQASGGKVSTKKGAAARSTKAGVQETSGAAETLSPTAKVTNKLIALEDALNSQEDLADKRNLVAFAALRAMIAHLNGKMEILEMVDIFFGDGTNLPSFEEPAETPAAAKKSATVKKAVESLEADGKKSAANAGGVKRGGLKEALAEVDEKPAGKKTAAKKSAEPAASSAPKKSAAKKSTDIDEDDDKQEKAAAKAAKKAPIPVIDDEDEDDDDFE